MLYQRSEPLKTERELLSKTIYYCRMGAAVCCISRKNIFSNETTFWSVQVCNTSALK
jgi:hypothetical protein